MHEGKVAAHVRYYEDYIRHEMNRGRSEQEVLEELGDPRLIARTILETSGMKAPEVEYTIDEEPADHDEGGVKVHSFSGWKATLMMALIAAAVIAMIVLVLGLAIYLLPVIIAVMLISWLIRKILRYYGGMHNFCVEGSYYSCKHSIQEAMIMSNNNMNRSGNTTSSENGSYDSSDSKNRTTNSRNSSKNKSNNSSKNKADDCNY